MCARGFGGSVSRKVVIDTTACNAVTQASRDAAQSFLNLRQPLAQVVSPGIELRIWIADFEAITIIRKALYRITLLGLGSRQHP